jgi:hypothetical protein
MTTRAKVSLLLTLLVALLTSVSALALDKGADGYYRTGSAIRVKTVVMVDIKVYSITHYMKELPSSKSKKAVIDADVGKKFVWTMIRDVDKEKIVDALKEAFAKNGYSDQGKIGKFNGAFGDLKEKARVTITYDEGSKNTTVTVQGGGSATINGVDFMKAVWSIWFGNIDQKSLGDQLISAI